MALVYSLPFVAFKTAATARIKLAGSGLYGAGTLTGSIVTPATKRLSSVFDARPSEVPRDVAYWVWGAKSGTPDGDQSTAFGQAGASSSVTGHVFYPDHHSTDGADEICARVVALFHHQPLVMAGWRTDRVDVQVIDVVPDPVGQHGIIVFRTIAKVVPA